MPLRSLNDVASKHLPGPGERGPWGAWSSCYQSPYVAREPPRCTMGVTRRTRQDPGQAVQVAPIKTTLKAPGIKLLKLKYGKPLSNFGFKFKLRHFTQVESHGGTCVNSTADCEDHSLLKVGRCRLTLSNPR